MNRRTRIILGLAIAAAILIAGLLSAPPVRLHFLANRLLYLVNSRQYVRALEDYRRIARKQPAIAERMPRFEEELLNQAENYFTGLKGNDGRDKAEAREFIDLIQQQTSLAPGARKLWLRLASRDGATSQTLTAAMEVLDHDGYDPDAIWWATVSQYHPEDLLTIPEPLIRFREQVEAPPRGGQAADEQQRRRAYYLKGLLALADRDWARAAAQLEHSGDRDAAGQSFVLVHGLTLLRSGRPETAISYFQRRLQEAPANPEALALLTEAQLAAGQYPWAAFTLHLLRQASPAREAALIKSIFGLADDSGDAPLLAFAASLQQPGSPHYLDAGVWSWLEMAAGTPEEIRQVDLVAENLIRQAGLTVEEQGLLLQFALRRGRQDLIQQLLISARRQAPLGSPWISSIESIMLWSAGERRSLPEGASDPAAAALAPGRPAIVADRKFLSENQTERIELELPPGAGALAVDVQGHVEDGIWPIVHLDAGPLGSLLYYAHDSRRDPIRLVLPLSRPVGQATSIQLAVSLLNADSAQSGARDVFIGNVHIF